MSANRGSGHRRAHRSLIVLIALSTIAAGGLATAASAPPSPMAGLAFAGSALLLAAAGTLAVRVVLALERARRAVRPRAAVRWDDLPVLSRIVGLVRRPER
ncbi:MAG: hypothetical protein WC580_00525 [Agrococcus sp.]